MSDITILISDDAMLFDVAQQAIASHLHLITNGQRYALSPVVPHGWEAMHVGFKEPKPCAA